MPNAQALPGGKQWFSPAEVATLLGRAAYTVREWCRLQRLSARKRPCGRGKTQEWEIHSDEVLRFLNPGLLPSPYAKKGVAVECKPHEYWVRRPHGNLSHENHTWRRLIRASFGGNSC